MKKLRFEEVSAAAQILVRYPGRSVLTMLGLAIGVAAFIAMVSFGEGARRSVIAQFQRFIVSFFSSPVVSDAPAQPRSPRCWASFL